MDYRLKRKGDFDIIFKRGNKEYARSLMLLYIKAEDLKIGMSVSKKHGNSVVRNRIKRLLRASYREYIGKIKENYHIVILPKVKENYSYQEYFEDIGYILKKERMIDDNK